MISGIAYDQVKGRIQQGFEFLREREVGHLNYPVRVYQVALDSSDAGIQPGEQVSSDRSSHFLTSLIPSVQVLCWSLVWLVLALR